MPLFVRNSIIALIITSALVGTVWYAVHYLDRARLGELTNLETTLAINTLSLETQVSLLENAPCTSIDEGTGLSGELSDLGDKLSFLEDRLGGDNAQVLQIKKQYTLLEIRDYLLTQKLAKTCKRNTTAVLYFYASPKNCTNCDRAGYALSYLRSLFPTLRVYSFQYDLDLGALKTLIAVFKVKDTMPAFIIESKVSYGFTDADTLKALLPKRLLDTASSTATSTKK